MEGALDHIQRRDDRRQARRELGLAALACAVVGWWAWNPLATSAWFFADDWEYFRTFVHKGYAMHLGDLAPWATQHRALDRLLKTFLFVHAGFDSDIHHHVQLALHVTTSLLVFALMRRLTPYRPAAWIAAAVFLLNRFTLHTVSWISLLHDDLTACLSVLVLLCWMSSWQPGARGWAWFAAAVVAFDLGLKAKEGIVTLPVFIVMLHVFFAPRGLRRVDLVRLGLLGTLAGVFLLCSPHFPTTDPHAPYFQSFHPVVISRSFWWYAAHMVFLSEATLAWLIHLPSWALVAGMTLVLGVPLTALAIPGAAGRIVVFGWAMLWLGLLPTAALPNHYDYEYYAYTPMVGAAIAYGGALALAATVADRMPRPRVVMAVAAATAWTLVATAYTATRALPEMAWYAGIGADSKHVMARLSEALPAVPPHSHVVLVGVEKTSPFRWLTWYPDGPSAIIQAWYRDPTLEVTLTDDASTAAAGDVVRVWTSDRFESPR